MVKITVSALWGDIYAKALHKGHVAFLYEANIAEATFIVDHHDYQLATRLIAEARAQKGALI